MSMCIIDMNMSSKYKLCRFCLKPIQHNDFNKIEGVTKQMLCNLLLKLDLNLSMEPVICKNCVSILEKSCNFKSMLLLSNQHHNTKDRNPFVKCEELSLENTHFDKNEHDDIINEPEDHKVCRFCMRETDLGSCTYLNETKKHVFVADMIRKHIPELDLNGSEEVVTCGICYETLQNLLSFITKCLDVEEKITKYIERTNGIIGQIKLCDIEQFIFNPTLKNEVSYSNGNVSEIEGQSCADKIDKMKTEIKNEDFMDGIAGVKIKNEELEIKSEESAYASFQHTVPLAQHDVVNSTLMKYEKCYEASVLRNLLTNRGSSEIKMYKCENCSRQMKNKSALRVHMLTHQNLSEVPTYKCGQCLFRTKRKPSLIRHMLTHQSVSEITMYICEICTFESKHKNSLKKHMLIHQDLRIMTVYKCELCSFETRRKRSLEEHILSHQDRSRVTAYMCAYCSFKSIYKNNLRRHMSRHQDDSKITMLKCGICSFTTKFKSSLRRHMLIHQDRSEVIMYKCEKCSFESKHTSSLKKHLLTHRTRSEVSVFVFNKILT